MKITISDKQKKEIFIALFNNLKNCSTIINITFETDVLHIQGMDKSHICLYDVSIKSNWFNDYQVENSTKISFDSSTFYQIISNKSDNCNMIIHFTTEDNLNIDLITLNNIKGEFNKYFKLPLCEYDYEEMTIPTCDYDAEFSISSKKICEILSQMVAFGADININCSEEKIALVTNGTTGEMSVYINNDDLSEYCIIEGEQINLTYSLSYISKMCLTNKLSNEIDFFISAEYPMKIKYDLGDESTLLFFIAPKFSD
jgi:proliferating cell nuclear antigen PCNA